MEKLLVQGHEVVFEKAVRKCWWGSSYSGTAQHRSETTARWDIPTLELHGYVTTKFESNDMSLDWIKARIEAEVRHDLDNRRKRELGIIG